VNNHDRHVDQFGVTDRAMGCFTLNQFRAGGRVKERRGLSRQGFPAAQKSILADGFAAGLDDPDSVRFRWAKVPKRLDGSAIEYCGLINVKSGTGGYKPFLATIRTESGNITGGAIAALNSDNLEENRDVIPKLCQRRGLNPFDAK
jgi:hypothetical protein